MFDLFDRTAEVSSAQYAPPNWQYLRSQLQINLQKVSRYYSTYPTAVKADHILARIITTIAIPKSLELSRYYDNVDGVSMDVAMALFLTSSVSFGRVHHGNFYNCPEVIIADFTPFDEQYVHDNWRSIAAVTVEYHPYTDLNMLLPEPKWYSPTDKVAYIKINITALMVQYRAFCISETESAEEGMERTLYQFIRMYVLPNMVHAHVDYAILNRMSHLLQGIDMIPSTWKHSFHLIDETAKVDLALEQEIIYYSKAQRDFKTILHAIPLVFKRRAIDLLYNHSIAPTQQVMWALQLSRVPAVKLLTLLCPENVLRANTHIANSLIRDINRIKSANMITRMFPAATAKEVQLELDDITNILTAS